MGEEVTSMFELGDDMQVNGTKEMDRAFQSVLETTTAVVTQPSLIAEPDDRLIAQSSPPPYLLLRQSLPGSWVV